jgi:CII-binding regulator of phage lambda lysogenization HflD
MAKANAMRSTACSGSTPRLPKRSTATHGLYAAVCCCCATISPTDGIRTLEGIAERQGSIHPDVISKLGQLYADTISHLRPKVIVQGNPHYLQQADVVAEIRALLLAALRSAVLWRQMGGTMWDFVLRKRAMIAAIEAELG